MLLFAKDKHEVLTPEHNDIRYLTWEMHPNDITLFQLYVMKSDQRTSHAGEEGWEDGSWGYRE